MNSKKKNSNGKNSVSKKCIDKKSVFLVSYLDQSSESDGVFPAYIVRVPTKQMAINYVANTDHNSRNFLVAENMPIIEPDESECLTEEEDSDVEDFCPECRREMGINSDSDFESGDDSGFEGSLDSDDLDDLEDYNDSSEESESESSGDGSGDEETNEETGEESDEESGDSSDDD